MCTIFCQWVSQFLDLNYPPPPKTWFLVPQHLSYVEQTTSKEQYSNTMWYLKLPNFAELVPVITDYLWIYITCIPFVIVL
jgi:hypothetical protein